MSSWVSRDSFVMAVFHVTNYERASRLQKAEQRKEFLGILLKEVLFGPVESVHGFVIRVGVFIRYTSAIILYFAYNAVSVQPSGYLTMPIRELQVLWMIQHLISFALVAVPLALWGVTNEIRFAKEIRLREARNLGVVQKKKDLAKARKTLAKLAIAVVGLLIFDFLPSMLNSLNNAL